MFRDEKVEAKVGLFIGMGIFLMFFIVFSISDITFLTKGYEIHALFDYVNGITKDSPVRLAGVHVGEVLDTKIFYDEESARTRVDLYIKINAGVRIETDAKVRINTLGLLGEQYLEITPGSAGTFLKTGDRITGINPVNIGYQMESMKELAEDLKAILGGIRKGEGTLGKMVTDDSLYDDLAAVAERLKNGQGTIGKLLVEETVYDNIEGFTSDIKENPWKLLHKPSGKKDKVVEKKRGAEVQPVRGQ
ncbi:MAG: MlaD family protein [Candidatus Omnitrophota bacterium]